MANPSGATKKGGRAANTWLFVVLGVLAFVGVIVFFVNRGGEKDPTFDAAPKVVSTPDHPIVIHTKSPEVLRLQEGGSTQGAPAGTR